MASWHSLSAWFPRIIDETHFLLLAYLSFPPLPLLTFGQFTNSYLSLRDYKLNDLCSVFSLASDC